MGIIVPDEEELIKYAAKTDLSGTFQELCQLKVKIHVVSHPASLAVIVVVTLTSQLGSDCFSPLSLSLVK